MQCPGQEDEMKQKLAFRSIIATVDQGILSLVNFVVALILMRHVEKLEFGTYSIAFAVVLFLVSIQNAIVNTQLIVLLPGKIDSEKAKYAGGLWLGQFCLLLPLSCLVVLLTYLLPVFTSGPSMGLVRGIALAGAGVLIKEFVRAYYFAIESPKRVLTLDILFVSLYAGSVIIFIYFFNYGVFTVFLLMGISSLLAALCFNLRHWWIWHPGYLFGSFRENWSHGKWALLGASVTHLQNYCYVYLLGLLLGTVAVAEVTASRLLLMPLIMFQTGWYKIAVPYGARLHADGQLAYFIRKMILTTLVLVAGTGLYAFIIDSGSGLIETYLLTEKYRSSFDYVFYWGAIFMAKTISLNANSALQVMKEFKVISILCTICMIISISGSYLLILSYGIKGGLLAMLGAELLLAILLWMVLLTKVRKVSGWQSCFSFSREIRSPSYLKN